MLATGVDLVEIARIETALTRWGDRFRLRVWTAEELAICGERIESLAARWAAKEAAAKALGVGLRGLGARSAGVAWTDIAVVRAPSKRPLLVLAGGAAALAAEQGLIEWAVSLSHSGGLAIASVVARG